MAKHRSLGTFLPCYLDSQPPNGLVMDQSLINEVPHLGRPVTINDKDLLKAARSVFLEKGATATTEEVARRAAISQASIFKRFKTKQDLFLAAMQDEEQRQEWIAFLRKRAPEVGLRLAMIELGVEIIGFTQHALPLLLVSWSNRGEFGFHKSSGKSDPVHELVEFLRGEMQQGRLNHIDPWSVVRAYTGSLQSFVLMSLVTTKGIGPGWTPTEYVTGVVDVLWSGLTPRSPPSSLARKKAQATP